MNLFKSQNKTYRKIIKQVRNTTKIKNNMNRNDNDHLMKIIVN